MSTNPTPPPNIDQRIEALTHSVELLSQIHQDNKQRYNRMFEQLTSANERLLSLNESIVQIVRNHEERIGRMEERQ